MNNDNPHKRIKQSLGSELPLDYYLLRKKGIKKVYTENPEDVLNLPQDICELGIVNDCALREYVDFHKLTEIEEGRKRLPSQLCKLSNLFKK